MRENVADLYPLSPMQQGLLFATLSAPEPGAYYGQMRFELRGPLDEDAMEHAWRTLVDRHAILRSGFLWDGLKEPIQVVHREVRLPLARHDLAALPAADQRDRLEGLLAEQRLTAYDLAVPPLSRLASIRLAGDRSLFAWSFHHLLLDGWSVSLLLRELFFLYEAYSLKRQPLLEPPQPYRSYIAWLKKQSLGEAEAFWRGRLAGFSEPTPLPLGRPVPGGEAGAAHRSAALDPAATRGLRELARRLQVTPSTVTQAAWGLLLERLTGERDLVFGAVVSGRPPELPGIESMVGLFVNTLPIRLRLPRAAAVEPFLREQQALRTAEQAFDHAPLHRIREWSEIPAGSVLFETLLAFQSFPFDLRAARAVGRLQVEGFDGVEQTDVPLTLVLGLGEALSLRALYDPRRLDAAAVERILCGFVALLSGLVERSQGSLAALSLLTTAEREELRGWSRGREARAEEAPLYGLFAARAVERPQAVAVVADGADLPDHLSFAELAARALGWARRLAAAGVSGETLVGLAGERSTAMVEGMLGILAAGGAYVPLDPSYPAQRLQAIVRDQGLPLVLAARAQRERLAGLVESTWLDLDRPPAGARGWPWERRQAGGESLAYAMYTSGSTGRPKGVAVPQRAVARLVRGADFAAMGPNEVFLQLAPTSFDAATLELWGSLANGARLVIPPPEQPSLAALASLLDRHRVSVLWLTAPLFHQMVDHEPASLAGVAQLLAGGDVLSAPHVRRALEAGAARVINGYGPTENTTFTCCFALGEWPAGWDSVPIGRPIAGTDAWVLDEALELVPPGVPGELYAGGAGLARGYLGQGAATAERFVPDPRDDGARLYRTGDRVRWREAGQLEFLGRADRQVKVRGFRIELGEVEAALREQPEVEECAVVVEASRGAEQRLVAYVQGPGIAAEELRRRLAGRLPPFMVPGVILCLDRLPMTPSGKLDRRRLPAIEEPREPGGPRRERPSEDILSGIWADVLGSGPPRAGDHFFEQGGHSLLATQMVARVRRAFGIDLPLRALFEHPTLEALAGVVDEAVAGGRREAAPILAVPRDEELPLSFAQRRLWFLDQLLADPGIYNVPMALELDGPLDVALLWRSLAAVVARHEVLRTRFVAAAGEPVQQIAAPAPLPLPVVELSAVPAAARGEVARRLARFAAWRFDLGRGPLLVAALLRLAPARHVLALTFHHAITDLWSISLLVGELSELCAAEREGRPAVLPALPVQYADYAAWQRRQLASGAWDGQLAYWLARLSGMPPQLDLPTDRPRPAAQSLRGAVVRRRLSPALAERLRQLSRRQDATLFMTLLAAFQALLARWSGQWDLGVASPVANRSHPEVERLIGFFVNTVVLRARMSRSQRFRALVVQTREAALAAYAHQELPFERLVEALQPERALSHSPLFQVMFVTQTGGAAELDLAGVSARVLEGEVKTSKFDLTLVAHDGDDGLSLFLEHSSDLFDASTVERLLGHWQELLSAAVEDPSAEIGDLPLLSEEERRELRLAGRTAHVDEAGEVGLWARFAAQAAARPEAVAVEYGEEQVSYGELAARSAALAAALARDGVEPGALVGLSGERSVPMLVGMLGILGAGAAYVPLDPDYPLERLAFMVEDSRLRWVVALPGALPELPATPLRRIRPGEAPRGEADPGAPPALAEPPGAGAGLAYVIYTSGSTGRPKGVAIHQRSVVRLVGEGHFVRLAAGDRIAQASNSSFDAVTFEVWGALLSGARLVGIERDQLLSVAELGARLGERRVDTLFVTTALFNQVVREDPTIFGGLRDLLFGGEAVEVRWVRRLLAAGGPRRLLHVYGPTETTTFATWHVVEEVPQGAWTVPIGRPLATGSCLLLDGWEEPAPDGVAAELLLGGAGLAMAYLGRPALTAERFVPHPWGSGERLYRTGDRVRRRADGALEFLGRADGLVKLRGFRIELGEIETALRAHPEVEDCAVVLREEGEDRRLVAYLVAGGTPAPAAEELRAFLAEQVPGYMLPSAFVALSALPLSPNGKVDRRALPAPELGEVDEGGYVAPATATEERLAALWAEVLGRESVSARANFFALGGHSLLATQVISRLRRAFGVDLPLRALYETANLAELAARVDAARPAPAGVAGAQEAPAEPMPAAAWRLLGEHQEVAAIHPLAPGQGELLARTRSSSRPGIWLIQVGSGLAGAVDRGALAGAWQALVDRHPVLRTSVGRTADGADVQVVHRRARARLRWQDWTRLPSGEHEGLVERWLAADRELGMDLESPPLIRLTVLERAADHRELIFTFHHLLIDGWSLVLVTAELFALYEAARRGRQAQLPAVASPDAYFAWLARRDRAAAERYWREELADLPPPLALPPDLAADLGAGGQDEVQIFLSEALSRTLEAAARSYHLTPAILAQAGWCLTLAILARATDLVLGVVTWGRPTDLPEADRLLGYFINTLPFRARIDGEATVLAWLASEQERLARWRELEHCSLAEVRRWVGVSADHPLYDCQMVFNSLPPPPAVSYATDLAATSSRISEENHYLLDLEVIPAGQWRLTLLYRASRFTAPAARRILKLYEGLLEELAARPQRRLAEVLARRGFVPREGGAPGPLAAAPAPSSRGRQEVEVP